VVVEEVGHEGQVQLVDPIGDVLRRDERPAAELVSLTKTYQYLLYLDAGHCKLGCACHARQHHLLLPSTIVIPGVKNVNVTSHTIHIHNTTVACTIKLNAIITYRFS
jgi:hypothetical protein